MAGKHRKEKIVHAPTKRQVSRWERQKKMSRIIMICGIAIVVIVVGLIVVGVYTEQVMPYQKIVVKVNDKSFDFDYYIKTLDMITKGAGKEVLSSYVDIVPQAIVQGELVREKAADVGITVTDDEANKEVEQGGLPKNSVAATDLARTRLITKKYAEQVCLPKIPASVQQAEVEAICFESKSVATERKQRLLLGDNVSSTASQLSVEPVTKDKKGYLGWVPKGYESYVLGTLNDSLLKDVIFTIEPKTWSDPSLDTGVEKSFGYWVVQVLEKDPSRGTHARGILMPFKDQAEDVRAQLLNGGSWDALAEQYSQAPSASSGGDLGWVQVSNNKAMLPRLLAAQEPNKISDTIRDDTAPTKGGYWLVQVKNRQDRPVADSVKQTVTQECLVAWVDGLMKDAKTETILDDAQKAQAVLKVTKSRSK